MQDADLDGLVLGGGGRETGGGEAGSETEDAARPQHGSGKRGNGARRRLGERRCRLAMA